MKRNTLFWMIVLLAAALGGVVRAEDGFTPLDATLRDRAVVMELPEGVRRVRLRVRQADGSWKIRTIAHLAGTERYLKLRLPDGVAEEDIEVAASHVDPFPYSHYQGQSSFKSTVVEDNTRSVPMSPTSFADSTEDGGQEPVVEESDIWKWRGNTVYFFNQYRGLQVIDVSDPANPERLATHRLPSSGEQMYLHPTANLVVLLTHGSGDGNGEVVLVRHDTRNELREQDRIPVPGYIMESRMVGEFLYVVSRRSFQDLVVNSDTGVEHIQWRSGLAVTRIDLRNPEEPVAEPALELTSDNINYWGAEVQATSRALLISTNAYDSVLRQTMTTVHVVDISEPAVGPIVTHRLPVAGQVLNKFNMRLDGDILTVVSQVWRGGTTRQRYASVETFDLTAPTGTGVSSLGHIEFAQNESITATRFVGDLLYVVTFLRIDPLFVVSLADPARPRLLSELEIPGFSTHLEPFGEDALISVGVEGSQIAVSWFDVSDPTNATMVSRVYVGAPGGWSWTEANWDEKAFGFFPEERLILLPYQGSDPENGWITGVQVIELGDRELIKRGDFAHEFRARRAKVLDTAIASISGRSLRTLDISDPDNPRILADLTLAWPADLVHRVGGSLVQLERGGGYWYGASSGNPARLHVSPVGDPDTLTATLDLGPGRVAGSLLVDNCLWVAQSLTENVQVDGVDQQVSSFMITGVDLSDPTGPVVVGRASKRIAADVYQFSYSSDYAGALLPDGSLVWYPSGSNNYFYLDFAGPGRMGMPFMPYFPSTGRVHTVDIADKTHPEILTSVEVRESDQHWAEGTWRLVGAVLYHGSRSSKQVPLPDGRTQWQSRHWLGQLDLTDPAVPVKLDPVELPGTFEHAYGTPGDGAVLFTSTTRSFYDEDVWRSEFGVQALAFDGVTAFLLDELIVPDKGYGPSLFDGPFIILGKNEYTSESNHADLTIYEWLTEGMFDEVRSFRRAGAVHNIAVTNDLLIASEANALSFIDFADPADPDPAAISFPNANYWQDLGLMDVFRRQSAHVPMGLRGVDTYDFGNAFAPVPARASDPGGPDGSSEWLPVELVRLLSATAGDALMIGSLATSDDWMVADGVAQIDYEEWTRATLGLVTGASAPAPWEDSDGDGLTNAWEYHTGSDPGDPASVARVETFVSAGPDGDPCFHARVFRNPHAVGTLGFETSLDARDWSPDPDAAEVFNDPFSTSTVVRFRTSVDKRFTGYMRFSFGEE